MKRLHVVSSALKFSLSLIVLFVVLLTSSSSVAAQGGPPLVIEGPQIKIVTAPPSPEPVYFPREARKNSATAANAATINVTYKIGNIAGCPASANAWGDTPPGESSTLQQAFERAVSTWGSTLNSSVEIRVEATLENIGSSTLGYMGPTATVNWGTQPVDDVWFPYAIADRIDGNDLAPNSFDIKGKMACRSDWNTDDASTDGDGYNGEFDFESVAVHELGHGLGFVGGASYSSATGKGGVRDDGNNFPWVFTCFTGSTNPGGRYLLNQNEFPEDSVSMGNVLTNKGGGSNGGAAGVYFYGNNAVNANDGPVKLYIPDTWEEGSSYSHLDSDTFNGTSEDLMTPSIGPGDITRAVGPVTQGMFNDFGWGEPFNSEACASPTPNAVTLQGVAASYTSAFLAVEKNNVAPLAMAGILVIVFGAAAAFWYRRK